MLICTQNQLQVFTKSQISTNFLWHRLPEKCSRLQNHWHSCLMRFIDFNILVDADADVSKIKGVNLILCLMGVKNLFFAHLCFLPPKVSKLFWARGPPSLGYAKNKGCFLWEGFPYLTTSRLCWHILRQSSRLRRCPVRRCNRHWGIWILLNCYFVFSASLSHLTMLKTLRSLLPLSFEIKSVLLSKFSARPARVSKLKKR